LLTKNKNRTKNAQKSPKKCTFFQEKCTFFEKSTKNLTFPTGVSQKKYKKNCTFFPKIVLKFHFFLEHNQPFCQISIDFSDNL